MYLREAFEQALTEGHTGSDKYQRTFELMYGRLPSRDEQDTIKRRCLWFESGPDEFPHVSAKSQRQLPS